MGGAFISVECKSLMEVFEVISSWVFHPEKNCNLYFNGCVIEYDDDKQIFIVSTHLHK